MQWSDARLKHPNTWLIIEALQAHSENHRRVVDRLDVVEVPSDGATAQRRYRELHRAHPEREFYFVHTMNDDLVIDERPWVGLRLGDEALTSQ